MRRIGCGRPLKLVAAAAAFCAATVMALPAAASAAGSAHWELIANNAPTNVPIFAPTSQEVSVHVVSAEEEEPIRLGRFKITVTNRVGEERETKPSLPYNATATEVEHALEALPTVGPGNVKVSGGPSLSKLEWTYEIAFVGSARGEEYELEFEEVAPSGEEKKKVKEEEKANGVSGEEYFGDLPEFEVETIQVAQRDVVNFQLIPFNRGAVPTSGQITIVDRLPKGFVTQETPESPSGSWECTPGAGNKEVTCKSSEVVRADAAAKSPPVVVAYAEPSGLTLGARLVDEAEISGGGAVASIAAPDEMRVNNTPATFGVHSFVASAYDTRGDVYTTAGGHPYQATTTALFNTFDKVVYGSGAEAGHLEPYTSGDVKDVDVQVPEGFLGNPSNRPHCSQEQFAYDLKGNVGGKTGFAHACPSDSQVGTVTVFGFEGIKSAPEDVALYNLQPPRGQHGVPAEFGFSVAGVPVRLDAHVRKINGQYQVTVLSANVNEALPIEGVSVTLWGTPAEASHNEERVDELEPFKRGEASTETPVRPFLINPTSCLAEQESPPETTLYVDQWGSPGAESDGEPDLSGPGWLKYETPSEPVTGCENLKFEPEAKFRPDKTGIAAVAAPEGYEFRLHIPQKEATGELATPELKNTSVTLPAGVVLSPGAANGLEACAPDQIEIESTREGHCPAASKVGEVAIESALLEEPLTGSVYIGEPECSPCTATDDAEGKLFRLYIEAEAPQAKVNVKLAGRSVTGTLETEENKGLKVGQVQTTFLNNPQTPFTNLTLKLKAGPRAVLANPALCGSYTTESVFTPWSVEGTILGHGVVPGDKPWPSTSSFETSFDGTKGSACPESFPFEPLVSAGTESSTAGQYSPLVTLFKRESDTEQYLKNIVVSTPPGLLGKVAGVEKCEVSASELEAETATCPAGSQIGEATTEAGAGEQPYTVTGKVYLAGATKSEVTGTEGPFGLDVVVPAKAGPFNLGLVVVQAVIDVNEETGALTVTSNPLPQSIDGIPFRIKQAEVKINRPEFTFNATHCSEGSIDSTLGGEPIGQAGEDPVTVARQSPYAATDCERLPFEPTFSATVNAHANNITGTSFAVKVGQRHGEADIKKVEVQLPENLPSRLETLQKACTKADFEIKPLASHCPAVSFVGTAEARTPLLNVPLKGRAVLEALGAKFPDLVYLLEGEGVKILLRGKTDIIEGITYSKFETVPDAPISSFVTSFPAGRYSLIGGLGDLCAEPLTAVVTITGQNNDVTRQYTRVGVEECAPVVKVVVAGARRGKLHLLVSSDSGGTLRISGRSVKTMTRSRFTAGAHEVVVSLSRSGKTAVARGRDVEVKLAVSAGGRTGSTTVRTAV
ncbi:MAG TPA: hypothetical protein VMA83_09100 [Solirubrobacteraceae bacterium]|nr:hypothetical protein [Solirubrobacteraceae bacterium]